MTSYYYTVSEPSAHRFSGTNVTGWRLSLCYYERRSRKALKLMISQSTNKKFRIPNLPSIYDTEEDAVANGTEFRELVENVVRGNRPRRTHTSTLPVPVTARMPPNLLNEKRAAHLIQGRVRRWGEQRQLEAQRVQDIRRCSPHLIQGRVRRWGEQRQLVGRV